MARPTGLAINRPTIPMADYVAAKNAATGAGARTSKTRRRAPATTGVTLFAQVASTNQTQSCCLPPDGDIATIGGTDFNAGGGPGGVAVYTSPLPLNSRTDSHGIHRTGDYSYIAPYPARH